MMNLKSIQNQFQQYLLNDEENIHKLIVQTAKISRTQRLEIYRNAYYSRLVESLASNFPILNTYLGSDAFYELSSGYIRQFPSPYRSIRWYGDSFADYLNQYSTPFLAELAEFEWKMALAFDAADEPLLTIEDMAAIPGEAWANLQFKPHSSLQRMNFRWNCVALWEAIANNQQLDSPLNFSQPIPWVLWRNNYCTRFYSLNENEAWALDALINGATFGNICEGLCHWLHEEEVGMRAASLLKSWIESGLLSASK